jgi:hypothetical protein
VPDPHEFASALTPSAERALPKQEKAAAVLWAAEFSNGFSLREKMKRVDNKKLCDKAPGGSIG